jgi:hypothetical protein
MPSSPTVGGGASDSLDANLIAQPHSASTCSRVAPGLWPGDGQLEVQEIVERERSSAICLDCCPRSMGSVISACSSSLRIARHMDVPTCFISYSWESEAHKHWVLGLATALQYQGVHTLLGSGLITSS